MFWTKHAIIFGKINSCFKYLPSWNVGYRYLQSTQRRGPFHSFLTQLWVDRKVVGLHIVWVCSEGKVFPHAWTDAFFTSCRENMFLLGDRGRTIQDHFPKTQRTRLRWRRKTFCLTSGELLSLPDLVQFSINWSSYTTCQGKDQSVIFAL